jgi:hypothetical protein
MSSHWVTTDTLACSTKAGTLTLWAAYCCHEAHANELKATIVARAARYGYDIDVTELATLPAE